jgi:hypothetical protein
MKLSLTALSLSAGAPALATEIERDLHRGPAPQWATLRSIDYAGSGCPAGSVQLGIPVSGDLSLIFDGSLRAAAAPSLPFTERRKNCQLTIDLDHADGWQYAVESAALQGYAALESRTSGTAKASFYFQGQAATAVVEGTLYGPTYRSVSIFDELSGHTVWSPCNARRALNMNLQVRVHTAGEDARASMTLGGRAAPASVVALKWRRCR